MTALRNMSIKALTEDDVQQAFEKTRNRFRIPGMRLLLLTESYYEKGLNLYREHFIPHEPMCKSVGIQWSKMVGTSMLGVFKQNLSMMLVDEKTEEPVAFQTISIISRNDRRDLNASIPQAILDMMRYVDYYNEHAQFFDHFETDEAFRFVALVVSENYRRRGLGAQIFQAAIDMIRNFGLNQVYVKGEGTSDFSQRIFEKEGFAKLYENNYDSWFIDGRQPFKDTGEHKSIKLYGRTVKQNK